MLSPDQKSMVDHLVHKSESKQIFWMAGYFSALADMESSPQLRESLGNPSVAPRMEEQQHNGVLSSSSHPGQNPATADTSVKGEEVVTQSDNNGSQTLHLQQIPAAKPNTQKKLTVAFASQTGNGEALAKMTAEYFSKQNYDTETVNLKNFSASKLKNLEYFVAVASTHGNGEPPETAALFFNKVSKLKPGTLDGLNFTILALGDSSYEHFCKAGLDLELYLKNAGAKPFMETLCLDLDYQSHTQEWLNGVDEILKEKGFGKVERLGAQLPATSNVINFPGTAEQVIQRPHKVSALVNAVQRLTDKRSDKNVFHVELEANEFENAYSPGDALKIFPINSTKSVEAWLKLFGRKLDNVDVEVVKTLQNKELTRLSVKVFNRIKKLFPNANLPEKHFGLYLPEVIKGLKSSKNKVDTDTLQSLVGELNEIEPRAYSISSSPLETPNEIHLTVALIQDPKNPFTGVCSQYLHNAEADDYIQTALQQQPHFHLPTDGNTPIVMIGAGTGIAPYRSFLLERRASEAEGKNVLIFGERTFRFDFLYQNLLKEFRDDGTLSHMITAFSRDRAKKVYVQDRIRENAKMLYGLIEEGAIVYLCGDAKNMSPAVEKEFVSMFQKLGGITSDTAEEKFLTMKTNGFFRKDVY